MTTESLRHKAPRLPLPQKSMFDGFGHPESGDCLLVSTIGNDPERLPGHPQTRLTEHQLHTFLSRDLCTPQLDRFSPWLWLVATQDSSHISSLTHQIVRGREITVTENPELHLVWHDKRVFIKPLPCFLLSKVFWEACFALDSQGEEVHRALLGFMRSYRYLIQHPSDFALAIQKGLVPVDCNLSLHKTQNSDSGEIVDFAAFIAFMEDFEVDDADVSRRFHYGDLRLSRLNFWAKFVLRQFTFSKAYGNYDSYFGRFYGPLLFLFGVLTIIINAIQLGFDSQDGLRTVHNDWRPLYKIGVGVCVAILLVICVIGVSLLALFVFMGLRETVFALRHLWKRRREGRQKTVEDGSLNNGSQKS